MTFGTRLLVGGLLGLAALFLFWFSREGWHAIAIFAGPPLLLAALSWNGGNKAAFWAGLFALGWFSHGVMVAWSRPMERELALIEVALSLVVVLAASLPGWRARFGGRR
jgi:uncharacterized membrane protein